MAKYGTHYPLLLQTRLRQHFARDNIEVINVGMPSYATPHCLILLSMQVLAWQPDIVILSENVNDLTAAYFPGITFDYANKYSNGAYTLGNRGSLHSVSNVLLQHSQLYWWIKKRLQNLSYQYDSRYRIRRTSYGDQPPSGAHEAFRRNLHSFVTLAKTNGIQVVLGTQPLEESEEYFRLHMGFKSYNDVVKYPIHSEFVAHHKAYNQTIREVAEEDGVYLADNDAAFNNNRALFTDFVHYTLEGANRLAENYAKVLIDHRLVQ
jgi:lysophospholipase L1-like esterase